MEAENSRLENLARSSEKSLSTRGEINSRIMNILEPNLLILASAGSGKTHQLGNRVIGLVANGVPPESIVALTFTRKAAGEFASSILTRLANAASDQKSAAQLHQDLVMPISALRWS